MGMIKTISKIEGLEKKTLVASQSAPSAGSSAAHVVVNKQFPKSFLSPFGHFCSRSLFHLSKRKARKLEAERQSRFHIPLWFYCSILQRQNSTIVIGQIRLRSSLTLQNDKKQYR